MTTRTMFDWDLNPAHPSRGTKRYHMFYRSPDGRDITESQHATKLAAQRAAARANHAVRNINISAYTGARRVS